MEVINPINSNTGHFKAMKKGKTFYSCTSCRERKVKCDGMRPTCSTCVSQDRTCNYQETTLKEEVTKEAEMINKKLDNINNALKKINKLCKSRNILNSSKSPLNLNKPLKDLLDLKKEFDNWGNGCSKIKTSTKIESSEDKKCDSVVIDSEINLILSSSALEFGYLDIADKLFIQVVDKISKDSILSTLIGKDYILSRLKDKSLPLHMKYSILSVGSKLLESYTFFNNHIYMCGSNYAEKAFEIISNDLANPSVDKIFSALILVVHYNAVSNFNRSLFLVYTSTKYAYLLKLNVLDASKYKKPKSNQEWISFEFKRRVWWFLYIRQVSLWMHEGTIERISSRDIAVKLPSNDYYYNNYNSDPCLKNYILETSSAIEKNDKNDVNSNRKNIDYHYIIVKAYIELGAASAFLNKMRINLSNLPENYQLQKLRIKSRILNFFEFLKTHYSYLELDQTTLIPKNMSQESFRKNDFIIFFVSSYIIRLACIISNMPDIVPYSLDPEQLQRSKLAKAVCIDKAIEITKLLKFPMDFLRPIIFNIDVYYSACTSSSILLNALKIRDHPKIQKIRESYKFVFDFLKTYEHCISAASDFESSIRINNMIYQKSIISNKKFMKLFPELELSQITKRDNNLWFIKPATSSAAFMCCSISSISPMYRYIFIKNWFENGVIFTRNRKYSNPTPMYKFTCSDEIACLDLTHAT
ncbi:multidrug resistance regulator 2 [Smittium culicis]|uniref:Multidrug resistance regulator 2 n=1 Tax=Smittium culicis TaxID=133412 RepID=A0A1R1XX15_9FUNG|nr:multidrug resistance regulator 2 [Smittium culicis]